MCVSVALLLRHHQKRLGNMATLGLSLNGKTGFDVVERASNERGPKLILRRLQNLPQFS